MEGHPADAWLWVQDWLQNSFSRHVLATLGRFGNNERGWLQFLTLSKYFSWLLPANYTTWPEGKHATKNK